MSVLISLASFLLWATGLANVVSGPWGHWEGIISAQFGTVRIELDLSKADDGTPAATFSVPERKLNGLPMLSLTVDGNTVAFEPAAIGARFKGDISADGSELSGIFEAAAGSLPVALTRKGEAHVAALPENLPVTKELEGTWNGTLQASGAKRLQLTVQNQVNRTAAATLVSLDEAGLTLPVAIEQKGAQVTIGVPAVSSSFAGTLSADGQELTGTFTTSDGFELPLTLRRGPIAGARK